MKKCVLFFIGLVFTLLIAIITDNNKTDVQEDNLANSEVKVDKNFAENRIAPEKEIWKR